MRISELISVLEDIQEDEGDLEVRLAIQPTWPFEHSIDDVIAAQDSKGEPVCYIGEARQIGYLPEEPTDLLGWGRK